MYTVVRFYSDGHHEYGADGLTEEEAKAMCSGTGTVGNGWIDVFTKEKQTRRKFSKDFVIGSYNARLNYLAACLWVKGNGAVTFTVDE
jgi:hypothetical protein